MRVMIADDEPGVRALVRMTLDNEAYEIVEAEDGIQALRLARQLLPDLILLDVMMPGLSGLEVCAALKREGRTSGITIVMLSALAQDYDVEAGNAAGADTYFTKPFSPLQLLRRVDEVLGARPMLQ